MRPAALVLVLIGSTAAAAPAHKPLPDKFKRAAGTMFDRAAAADAKGDRAEALGLYRKAFEIVPHPNIAFNIAELDVALGDLDDAVVHYDLYLALAPDAPDRAPIAAAIAKIEQRPATIVLDQPTDGRWDPIDFAAAYVLLDGAIVHRPGRATVPPLATRRGRHAVDIVTSLTDFHELAVMRLGAREEVEVHAPLRIDGNVVISVHDGIEVVVDGKHIGEPRRLAVKPGKHRIAVLDSGRECPPLTLDAPAGQDSVGYLIIAPADEVRRTGCRALHVEQHRLVFAP